MAVLRALALALLLSAAPLAPVASAPGEYQVKAVFLFNFSQFVEWPADAFASPAAPFTICVLGQDPFGGELDAAVQGEKVQGHPLKVQRYQTADEASGCHILFIGSSELAGLDGILTGLKGRSILTVTDIDRS